MMKMPLAVAACLIVSATAHAQGIVCKGSITSIQGEGLVARKHRFEVEVSGSDISAVLEQCKRIALERQNVAAKRNPGGIFRDTSEVDLACHEGEKTFQLRRSLRTRE